ncbi:hypothetical protein [Methylomonas lenta]|uniref:hypothetical protein n=1 Tax=Methylomonas lenta TaxID=980561 RepID=UPI001E2BE867|nr:hypothetical protein [Methylomonas lenta]
MMKIKSFNTVLTLAAFAALYFFLPADKVTSNVVENTPQTESSQLNVNQKSNLPKAIRGSYLHSA